MSIRISEVHEKLARAYTEKSMTLMEEAVADAKNAGLPDMYAAMLASRDNLKAAIESGTEPELPSLDEELQYEANLSNPEKLELLKAAIANQRGFICDRLFSLKSKINGVNRTQPHYIFARNNQEKSGNVCSSVAELYRQLFWDENLDRVFFDKAPEISGFLAVALAKEVSECETVEEADTRLPELYGSIFQTLVSQTAQSGLFDPRIADMADAIDRYNGNENVMGNLRAVYMPTIQRLIATPETFDIAMQIADMLGIPVSINYTAGGGEE